MLKKSILVSGGAGYIGSNTVAKLICNGYRVIIVDNLSTGFKELLHPDAIFYNIDITDIHLVYEILRKENVSGVIHFAAKTVIPESIDRPIEYYSNNTSGVISILKACKMSNVRNFVFSSTAAVYGNASSDLISENNPLAPMNPYGFSKLFSEQIIRDCEKEFSLRSIIFRYFNVAGASLDLKFGQRSKMATHLIKIACETATKKRKNMSITGTDYPTPDGTGIRDFIHVEDLAIAHVLAMEYLLEGGQSDLFNCGYGQGYSVREVVSCIKKVSGVNFESLDGPRRAGDCAKIVADPKHLISILNWKPKFNDLELICKTALDFEKTL